MLAVKSKQSKLIDLLLEVEGIQLDVQTKRGFSALMIAAWKGDNPTINKLCAKGAKIELKDGGQRNAWGIAHDWHNDSTLDVLGNHGLTFGSHGVCGPTASRAFRAFHSSLPLQTGAGTTWPETPLLHRPQAVRMSPSRRRQNGAPRRSGTEPLRRRHGARLALASEETGRSQRARHHYGYRSLQADHLRAAAAAAV